VRTRPVVLVALAAALGLAAGLALAAAAAAHHDQPAELTVTQAGPANTTWRAVDVAPNGTAVLAGARQDDNRTRDVLATWTPEDGLDVVYDEPGAGLVDVSVRGDGRHLAVGLHETILVGTPGDYTNAWNESSFADQEGLTFYGLGVADRPGGEDAVVAGSSLLRLAPNGSLETLHGGQGAFFRTVAYNPDGRFAFVEAALEHDGEAACRDTGTVYGTIWRTDGTSPLTGGDSQTTYGREEPGCAQANAIAPAPNGTFALAAGQDGPGASVLSWAPDRGAGEGAAWRYLENGKDRGSITCADWHPDGRYAATVGQGEDPLGVAGARSWVPILHEGPGLFGCAQHPDGDGLLAVGANRTIAWVPHDPAPVPVVGHPSEGALVAPRGDQSVLVDVIDRGGAANLSVRAEVEGTNVTGGGVIAGPWWEVELNTSALPNGEHTLAVTASSNAGSTTVTRDLRVNDERFAPPAPNLTRVTGLEGENTDADGAFTLHWEGPDEPVVYEVLEERAEGGDNATRTLDAGGALNRTVHVQANGTYTYTVRAVNAYGQAGAWSDNVVVNVAFDQDRAGEDPRDERCPTSRQDIGWPECVLGTDDGEPNATGNRTPNETPDDEGSDRSTPGPGPLAALAGAAGAALARRRAAGEG